MQVGISRDDVKTILDYDCYIPGSGDKISFTSFRRIVMNELGPDSDPDQQDMLSVGEGLGGDDGLVLFEAAAAGTQTHVTFKV